MRRSIAVTGMLLTFVVGLAGASALQEGGGMGGMMKVKKDAFLDKMVGKWAFEGTQHMMGQKLPFTAETKFEWACGNRVLLERSTQSMNMGGAAMSFEWLTVSKANGDGTYRLWFFDQMGMAVEAKGKVEEGTLSWSMDLGGMGEGRSNVSFDEEGSLVSKGEMKPAGGDAWMPSMEMKGKKK